MGLAIEQRITIDAPPARVLDAFFQPADLAAWWEVARSVTLARLLGPYVVEWPPTEFVDEVLGRLGGTLHGTVVDVKPGTSFDVANTHWHPPDGDPIGPMALQVQVWPDEGLSTLLIVRQSAGDEGPRWERYFALMSPGWERALANLKAHLEGQHLWQPAGRRSRR
jgi:uncharacterized protein YndB with AHSA1/START domain